MKLIRSNKKGLTFAIGKRDKHLLFQLLKLYPLVPPAHHRLSKVAEHPRHDENQRLLDEALAETRRENREQVLKLMNEPGRFREANGELELHLDHSQVNWLLQVLNDVRVGAWLALGEPEPEDEPELNQTNATYVIALQGAGYFESELLDALGVKNPTDYGEV